VSLKDVGAEFSMGAVFLGGAIIAGLGILSLTAKTRQGGDVEMGSDGRKPSAGYRIVEKLRRLRQLLW